MGNSGFVAGRKAVEEKRSKTILPERQAKYEVLVAQVRKQKQQKTDSEQRTRSRASSFETAAKRITPKRADSPIAPPKIKPPRTVTIQEPGKSGGLHVPKKLKHKPSFAQPTASSLAKVTDTVDRSEDTGQQTPSGKSLRIPSRVHRRAELPHGIGTSVANIT
ncbi:uncharacterized protein BKA78DRAFT_348910 [Phyllosticta capitalensis]|uniref:uncharacterized protein n=1 Tax=Phyllosticta capitalensis TaxID=121624 RepID=UPI00312D900C